jgi:hypothetical protein
MRRSTCCLLVILFGSWLSSFGQSVPRLTSPKIVATFERIGQTADIPPTTLYTPQKWGTYRITVVMVLTSGNGNGNFWEGELVFVDGAGMNGSRGYTTALPTGSPQTASGEFPIRARAGKPLTFSVTPNGDTSGTKYNVWVVVEQLM